MEEEFLGRENGKYKKCALGTAQESEQRRDQLFRTDS